MCTGTTGSKSFSNSIVSPLWRSLSARPSRWRDSQFCSRCVNRRMTTDGRFESGDTALLRRTIKSGSNGYLLWPLQPSKRLHLNDGVLEHDNIIGKHVRDVVTTHTGRRFLVHNPTLEEYVQLTPRICTPIYATDANLIVSLLDIHVPEVRGDARPSYSILEAGTGHGSLTLHLARALRSGHVSPNPSSENQRAGQAESNEPEEHRVQGSVPSIVIHTVDNNNARSKHAQKIVRGFRQGLYSDNVEFFQDSIEDFLKREENSSSSSAERPFMYNHIILDLPGSHKQLALAATRLKVDGCLLLWVPSITQILDAAKTVRKEGLPLYLDRVVEVGQGVSGGRLWDVRSTRIRQFDRNVRGTKDSDTAEEESDVTANGTNDESCSRKDAVTEAHAKETNLTNSNAEAEGEAIVCRPKVGERTIGGGFIGLWRRIREDQDTGKL